MASLVLPGSGLAAASDERCTDRRDAALSTRPRLRLSGLYALPRKPARTLVVFAHGYRKPATVYWQRHLRREARGGAIAVAMDYRGIGGAPDYRGWNVRAGAADSIRAARHFWQGCRSLRRIILVSVSMGSNAAGLALAAQPVRHSSPCTDRAGQPRCAAPYFPEPLFDHWVNVEGAANVTETYLEAVAVAPGNAYARAAKEDIEREMGGTIAEVPERYREATLVARAEDIAASGVRSVTFVHGLEDGLVPYDQSRELAAALRRHDVPSDFFTVLTRGEGDDGTTISGYALGPAGQNSPFAGHGSEEDITHLVIRTGFERLWAIRRGATVGPAREFVVDGILGTHPAP